MRSSLYLVSFLRLHFRHLYPPWSLWGWRWCQTWTGSKKCHRLCARHCHWRRPMQLLSASTSLRSFLLNLFPQEELIDRYIVRVFFVCYVSSGSLAFEAPFYGEACQEGECQPGHRLERNAEVALAQYAYSASFAQSRFHSESISLYWGGTIDQEVLAMGSLCTLSRGSLQRGLWQSGRSLVQGGKRMWEIYLTKLGKPHDWKHPERTKVFKTPQLLVSLIGVWPLRSWPSSYSKSQQLHAMSIGHHSSCQRQ